LKSETNAQGHYVIPYLLPGQYKVQVEHEGFKSYEQDSIELRVSDRIEVNAVLQVGQVTEKLTVTAEVALVETSTGSRGQVIDNKRINDLPLNGRNPPAVRGARNGCAVCGQYSDVFSAVRYAAWFHNQRRPARRERDPDR